MASMRLQLGDNTKPNQHLHYIPLAEEGVVVVIVALAAVAELLIYCHQGGGGGDNIACLSGGASHMRASHTENSGEGVECIIFVHGWLSELASMVAATDVADRATGQTQDGPTLAGIGDDMDIDWAADWDKYPEVSSCPDTARTNPLLLAEDLFPGAGKTYGQAPTFMDTFDADIHAEKRVDNIFYPFANKDDWEMASFLLQSGLSVAKTDEFLSLNYVALSAEHNTKTTSNAGGAGAKIDGVLRSNGEYEIIAPARFRDCAEHRPNVRSVESGIRSVTRR
ncbi:hypothetical protein HETIRDRAFT_429464 [Heterobasidion irregulare TC 32-1]|uniref:Uncharacterized protein n=1 Tax=Heterobasidion irregulare (strain TC 32-1) TaxID=747525 RepID=W4JW54_HETIT|nr:uncharacterized protein HETIRDRAFT_429464 [Heterobasidion irregulare TC 32-1]ETW77121.1 hypothetical protein HETIRDRAFT_429464 [Heterobasidion irregulare TC 32-1]